MNKTSNFILASRWRQAAAGIVAGSLLSALLVACGGGGDSTSAAGGNATPLSFASGPIGGLGSIIVGGVRFDDSTARIEDDDDGSVHQARELKLGMMVEVQAGAIDDSSARATASLIRFGSELTGAVQSIDSVASTLRLLDQTIEIKSTTVFEDGLAGLAAVTVGQILEVHALFDATSGHYVATRVESEVAANAFRLRGVISALDATAKTFKINDAVINYASVPAGSLPAVDLANGQRVRVRLQTTQVNGQWVALTVRNGVRRVDDIGDARIRGLVTSFTSPQRFDVQGVAVDASAAVFEPNAAAVHLGAIVDVRGRVANGAIVATRVKVRDGNDDDIKRVELHGDVSGLDTANTSFMLRDVKVNYSRVLEWKNGSAADLANGKRLEVKGLWSEDRRVLLAVVIEFE